uniref:Dephospho-CoA kinase n=1 Tax=Mesocestoides corti TaxID=53468 RepID=A0A5K3EUJ3_MESCO
AYGQGRSSSTGFLHIQLFRSLRRLTNFSKPRLSMLLVGLTGGIATGKSTISDIIRENGYPVIDADAISRNVVDYDRAVQRSILKSFGSAVFNEDGTRVERDKLGEIIFADPQKKKILNAIVHPVVIRRIAAQILWNVMSGHVCVVLDIPLLFETGSIIWLMSEVVVVKCSAETQLSRLLMRNPDLSREAALRRIHAQMPMETKVSGATFVIDNEADGDFEGLRAQVDAFLVRLQAKASRRVRCVGISCAFLAVGLAVAVRQLLF